MKTIRYGILILLALSASAMLFWSGMAASGGGIPLPNMIRANVPQYNLVAPSHRAALSDFAVEGETRVVFNWDEPVTFGEVAGTGSMLPFMGKGSLLLMTPATLVGSIQPGDIIVYSFLGQEYVAHRVTEIGSDAQGWWAKAKGYNNREEDWFLVREKDLKWIVLGVIW